MSVLETPQAPAVGCWDLRGIDLDSAFAADVLSDTALTAAYRTSAKFSVHFPGWFLYRRVVAGVDLFDRQLEAWAVMSARMLSRSLKDNGRDYIGPKTRAKPLWVAQAGRDGLDFCIYGKHAEGLHDRAERFGVSNKSFQAIRDPVGRAMWIGLDTFRAQLHAEFWRVREQDRRS